MKKFASLAVAGALMLAPAFAGSTTVEYTDTEGEKQVWTFNDDLTATGPDGLSATYTWDEASKTLCAEIASTDGGEPTEACVTYEAFTSASTVGDASAYTTSTGKSGTAVITAKS
ncbi:MAG: hypothetical protein ACFB00_07925 [Parvularculaceae bacterium]